MPHSPLAGDYAANLRVLRTRIADCARAICRGIDGHKLSAYWHCRRRPWAGCRRSAPVINILGYADAGAVINYSHQLPTDTRIPHLAAAATGGCLLRASQL